jgi:hypothetical protein
MSILISDDPPIELQAARSVILSWLGNMSRTNWLPGIFLVVMRMTSPNEIPAHDGDLCARAPQKVPRQCVLDMHLH